MVHFGDFLKTWSLRSNSVTRQVTFNKTKNWWKMPKLPERNSMVTKNHDVFLHWNFSIAIFVSLVKEFLDSFGLPSVFETLADHESRHDIKSTSDGTNGARLTVGIHHWRRERGAEDDSYTPMKTEKVPLQLERRYRIKLGRYLLLLRSSCKIHGGPNSEELFLLGL